MVNLLKEEHKNEFKKIKKPKNEFQQSSKKPEKLSSKDRLAGNNDDNKGTVSSKQNPSLSRYRDPEGLTVGKMEFGFWFIKNKQVFVRFFYGILIVVSIITWSLFFYTFGHYVIIGMKQDRELAQDLTKTLPISHATILSRMPKSLIYDTPEPLFRKDLDTQIVLDVENPNEKHWAIMDYSYYVNNKEILQNREFILPKERKYFFDATDNELLSRNNVNIKVNSVVWVRHKKGDFDDYEKFYNEHIDFLISKLEFTPAKKTVLTEKLPINTLSFNITNNTAYNYWQLPLNVILYGGGGVQGFSKYTITNIMSGDKKEILLSIPGLYGKISEVEVFPNLNIMLEDIYIDFKPGEGEM